VGFIFSANPLGAVIAALIVGKIITDVRLKNRLVIRKIDLF
jgi:hypothetical protein